MARVWQTLPEDWNAQDGDMLELPHDMTPAPVEHPVGFRLRQITFYVLIMAVFAAFVMRLWQLQVTQRA